jgi:hypothetical protein
MRARAASFATGVVLLSGTWAAGQTPIDNPSPVPGAVQQLSVSRLSSYEFWLSVQVLVLGVAVLVVEYLLLRGRRVSGEEILRVLAVTLIVVATLFVVTAGFSAQQISPAMGLLGTIAGYLLGRRAGSVEGGDDAER